MTRTGNRYDVVVAGAGPAGSASARRLARDGYRVLMLEEHPEVGTPLHCSGLVTPRTLEEAGVDASLVLHRVIGAKVLAPSGAKLTLGDGQTRALVIDRVGLDRALVLDALQHGASMELGAKVMKLEQHAGELDVLVEQAGTQKRIRTRLLVGADGAHSRVARATGLEGHGERVLGLGAEGALPGADQDHVQVFVGRSIAPGWFAWTIPMGDGRVRLGVGTSDGVKPVECLRRLFQTFPEHFQQWQPTRWTGGTIPLWSRRKTVADNVMLVGDAAAQVKPTSGGGIYPSLVGARIAANVASQALARGDLSEKALSAYPRAWDRTLGKEFRHGADLRRVYTALDDRDFGLLLRLFGRQRLLRTINRYGDIDFPGSLFQRLAKLAPMLWLFVRTPLRYAPLWK